MQIAKSFVTLIAAFGLCSPGWTQSPGDEPGRGVARISLLNGDVSVQRGDSGDVIAAAVNAPLVVQDHLVTGVGSRAELQFDWSNLLRLAEKTEVRLAELEQRRYITQVARGTVTWRVLRDQDAYVEISTPSISVRPVRPGAYRISVHEDGSSEVTVRSGEAEVFTPKGSERLRAGRSMVARGLASDPEFQIGSEIPADEWDRWNQSRDRDLQRSRSYRYLSRDIYGAEDLDDHGRWVHVSSYGWVWTPRVAAGWAPYRHGRWSWIDWYGWTWVSHDPWGWAPYHYGRWFWNAPYGWCWWPGSIRSRHYWSPGFVAFFGLGRGGFSVGAGWGRVGWVPLAPWEPYHRWWGNRWYGYGRNRAYVDNSVTVVNNINVRNVYRNARLGNAVTVVDGDGFRQGRFSGYGRLRGDELRQASLARGPVPLAPERASLRLTDRDAATRVMNTRGSDRFFSNRRPAQVERVPFEDQRRGIERIAQRNFGNAPGQVSNERRGFASPSVSRSFQAGQTNADTRRGWREVNENARGARARGTSEAPQVDGGSGWRRFGSARAEERNPAIAAPAVSGSAGQRRSDSGGEWRRFGSARATEARQAGRDEPNLRFGQPSAARSGVPPRSPERSGDTDSWRRFGDRSVGPNPGADRAGNRDTWRNQRVPAEGAGETRGPGGASRAPRSAVSDAAGVRQWSGPRRERRADFGGRRSESIRISPPIVRERSGGSGRGSFGGSGMSAPRSGISGGNRAPGGNGRTQGGGGSRGSSGGSRGGGRGR